MQFTSNKTRLFVNSTSGILSGAHQLCSPHCDARPDGIDTDLIVIHAISLPPSQYGDCFIDDLFCGKLDKTAHSYFGEIAHLRVSSHLLIKRDGSITQYVPFHCRAWHAGKSSYAGRESCNDFSIGIELEGCDEDVFEKIQYQSLNSVISALCDAYPSLSWDRITGHSDIAPGRKTDPGPGFDWSQVKASKLS
jgi:AmpD protein